MMTIDEAIIHAEEIAEINENIAYNTDSENWMDIAQCEKCAEEHRQLAEWLNELKQYQWIPVSERLPEDIKPVIITWKNTDPASYYQYIVGKHFIGTGHYCNGKWFWYSSVCEDLLAEYGKSDIDELDEAIEVIAWMPLPEPYKRGEEK